MAIKAIEIKGDLFKKIPDIIKKHKVGASEFILPYSTKIGEEVMEKRIKNSNKVIVVWSRNLFSGCSNSNK